MCFDLQGISTPAVSSVNLFLSVLCLLKYLPNTVLLTSRAKLTVQISFWHAYHFLISHKNLNLGTTHQIIIVSHFAVLFLLTMSAKNTIDLIAIENDLRVHVKD